MHTEYSLLDSCTNADEYIELAVRDGLKAISFSEHGKPLNWCEKWAKCKKAGIRYIHSVEIYLTESIEEKVRDNYHTVLMAKNEDGVKELNSLVSLSCDEEHFYYTNRLTFDEFLGISDNIISTSACLASPLNKLEETHPRYMELANKYDFLEIQAHPHPEQVDFNKRLLSLSKRLNKPLIAGTDSHSSTKYKAECRNALLSSKRKTYGDEDYFDLTYKTYDELVEMFRVQGALDEKDFLLAIENTNLLYEMTEDIEIDTSIKYPILYGSREADSEKFAELIEKKLVEKLKSGVIPLSQEKAFREAIREETRVFKKLNMDGFMLLMAELLSWCREQGFAIGTGRGSVGGSRCAYITDIIDLNAEEWNTVFSRFCNEDREEIGDIDIDCVEEDRPKIFKYIIDRFGESYTARVSSFSTLQSKGVIDDVGRHLAFEWEKENDKDKSHNPWSIKNIAKIKREFEEDESKTKEKYPELFYFYDGLLGTKITQSVHPAGMVISPIILNDNYGVFNKDGENCLVLDMDNIHDYTGLAKYDFLILSTLDVIKDTCKYIGKPYPRTHEIDWYDQKVWDSIITDSAGIFQFESPFAFDCLKKFKPSNIFDMSIVNACIRPSGASYRSDLLARKIHKNPSALIDELFKDNLGYLIYQEDTIKFLQQICGLSGSEADNIRRAIGRKQKDRLDAALPSILKGYSNKSPETKEVAEKEAEEFLRIIEDSASYQFGYNHSIAYCLLGYLCAYYRYYHPLEFITSSLNNAPDEDSIKRGTQYANKIGIKITMPKWGVSKGDYFYNKEKGIIAKGLSSVKHISLKVANELFEVANSKKYTRFIEILNDVYRKTSVDARQIDILIKIDFFSEFGNQRELIRIASIFEDVLNRGSAKQISKKKVDGTPLQPVVEKYSIGVTKSGGVAKSYRLLDINSIMKEIDDAVKSLKLEDLSTPIKVKNFADIMGYAGYTSNKESDRRKLYILETYPLVRRSDKKQFGYSIITKSIGSGKEGRFSVMNRVYNTDPIKKGDIIYCKSYYRDKGYFTLTEFSKIY